MTTILFGKKILITAGPTQEAIDPVRFISNNSSGKMGYAIAEQFLDQGAEVILISGPVSQTLSHPKLRIIPVLSAMEMYMACCKHFETVDIVVFSAAVADYRPSKIAEQKIKKKDSEFTLHLVKNIDIAYEFGKIKLPEQISVGFALETENEMKHALQKLQKKNFDFVVLNSMNDAYATFGYETNRIKIIHKNSASLQYPLKHKKEVAKDIIREIASLIIKKEYEVVNE